MTPRERFLRTIRFENEHGPLPMIEWAAWWDKTIDRWKTEGLDPTLDDNGVMDYFGLDKMLVLYGGALGDGFTYPSVHGGPVIGSHADYRRIQSVLYPEANIDRVVRQALRLKPAHDAGEIVVRLWLDGFFWHPRQLFGIEGHFYAFYDEPALMAEINKNLAAYNIRLIIRLCEVLVPDMIGYAEDMSYNHGPMLSRALFDEFILPYYRQINPIIHERGIKVLVDSDGDITEMIPWLADAGIDGVYPLERQAGVDIVRLRAMYPWLIMMGGYDKMVMNQGEAAIRGEFERLLPVMRSGGFVPSVDHQTPPGVSLADYMTYIRLFKMYTGSIHPGM